MISNRFIFNLSGGITQLELIKRYRREYQQPIRLKVINVVKHWIDGYYSDDFSHDTDLLKSLHEFIEKIGRNTYNKKYQSVLMKILQKKLNSQQKHQKNEDSSSIMETKLDNTPQNASPVDSDGMSHIPKSMSKSTTSNSSGVTSGGASSICSVSLSSSYNQSLSSRSSSTSTNEDLLFENTTNANNSSNFSPLDDGFPSFETHLENMYGYDLLTIHPLEFVRQVTLMESELFRAIKPNELISLGWTKPKLADKFRLSPNVMRLIYLSNKLTYWYAKCIVDTSNLEERVAVVLRILDMASYFYQINNFSGLKEIYAALDSSSVERLKITRERSNLEQHEMFHKFKQLFDNHEKGALTIFIVYFLNNVII